MSVNPFLPNDSQPASSTVTLEGTYERNGERRASRASSSSNGVSSNGAPPPQGRPLWTHRLSASFSAMADQISAASHALAQVPADASILNSSSSETLDALSARMDAIEAAQERLGNEIEFLKSRTEAFKGESNDTVALEKKLEDLATSMKLDQTQLYARLQNSRATISKNPIMAPPMANGKTPPNFPATKGEFEHLTRERYEAILQAYGQIKTRNDIGSKREALRSFLGLPA